MSHLCHSSIGYVYSFISSCIFYFLLKAENQNLKQKMLQVEELVLGPASSEVAKSLNELGVLLYLQNNHE